MPPIAARFSLRLRHELSSAVVILPNFESFLGYSCALVSDILLQGHLYITENYFAFHSNVFGYVTKVREGKIENVLLFTLVS